MDKFLLKTILIKCLTIAHRTLPPDWKCTSLTGNVPRDLGALHHLENVTLMLLINHINVNLFLAWEFLA